MTAVVSCFLRSRARTVYRLLPTGLQYINTTRILNIGLGTPRILLPNQWMGMVRGFSDELRIVIPKMSEADYHHVSDEALDNMVGKLEAYVEDRQVEDGDVEYSQGVLTIKLGKHGTFVINKQTPNRQIWLSSPVSGPFRFDYLNGRWIYSRDGRDLVQHLEQEIGTLVGSELHLE